MFGQQQQRRRQQRHTSSINGLFAAASAALFLVLASAGGFNGGCWDGGCYIADDNYCYNYRPYATYTIWTSFFIAGLLHAIFALDAIITLIVYWGWLDRDGKKQNTWIISAVIFGIHGCWCNCLWFFASTFNYGYFNPPLVLTFAGLCVWCIYNFMKLKRAGAGGSGTGGWVLHLEKKDNGPDGTGQFVAPAQQPAPYPNNSMPLAAPSAPPANAMTAHP